MFEVEKKIANFILEQELVIHMTEAQVADNTGVAESSIVRFCQRIGFSGFTPEKSHVRYSKMHQISYTVILKSN
jgi:DNA-binding MurR/RpiR family transcriptional regulator